MDETGPRRALAWLAFALLAVVYFSNFYVYDSIGPVADLLQQQRRFSDTQIGMLNAIYSLPNIVLILVGGVLVDRYGAARMLLWSTAVCLSGAVLTAFGPDFTTMATGRLLFGIGAETQNIAMTVAIIDWFAGGRIAFAMGLSLAIGRSGSFSADMSPAWFAGAYAGGWQPPLLIAAVIAAIGMVGAIAYRYLDARSRAVSGGAREPQPRLAARDLLTFGHAYWYLLVLCVLWYAVILAFRSTFAIKYFQHAHGLDLATAGAMNSYVFLSAMFATPAFGWLCDRTGRYAPMLVLGALLLPLSLAIMAYTSWSLWIATALIGVSYSLVPAVMWPLLSKLVAPERFGTALGLMWVVQNAGIAGANLLAGWLNDQAGAGALNPAGYEPMMRFFGISSSLGFVFAVMLWLTAGRRRHEVSGLQVVQDGPRQQ
jgi:MFS family permease